MITFWIAILLSTFFLCQGHITKTLGSGSLGEHPRTDEGNAKVKFAFKGATPSRKRKDKCDFQVPDGEDEISFSRHNK